MAGSDYFGPNSVSIQCYYTNSPYVVLIRTRSYLRFGCLCAKERQEARLQRFHESLEREFKKLKFVLVAAADWEGAVTKSGQPKKLSPFWGRSKFGSFTLRCLEEESA